MCQREQHLRPRMALPEPSFRGTYSRSPCHSQRSPGLTLVPGPILSVLCAVGWSWRLRCAPRPAPAIRAVTLGVRVWRPRHRVTRRVGQRGGHLPVAPPGLPGRRAFLRLQTRSVQGTAGAALRGGGDPRRRPWAPTCVQGVVPSSNLGDWWPCLPRGVGAAWASVTPQASHARRRRRRPPPPRGAAVRRGRPGHPGALAKRPPLTLRAGLPPGRKRSLCRPQHRLPAAPRRPGLSRTRIPRAGAWGSQAASGPALCPATGRASGARLSVPPRGTRPLQVSGRSPTRLAARELSSHLYLNLECHRGGVASSRNSVSRRNHCFSAPCWC